MYVRILLIVLGVVLVSGFAVSHLAYSVVAEKRDFARQAEEWALSRTAISDVEEVFEYRGTTHCAVVIGKNRQGSKAIAWLTKDWVYYDTLDGKVTQESVAKAVAQGFSGYQVIHIVPGIENRKPLWEALLKNQEGSYLYVYYDFYNGQIIKSFTIHSPLKA